MHDARDVPTTDTGTDPGPCGVDDPANGLPEEDGLATAGQAPAAATGSSKLGRFADETGAQAMEYAMLGGAGVASVSILTWLMRQPWFADAMEGLFSGLLQALTDKILELLPVLGGVV